MKLFDFSTRPTSFPTHPGPALGKWLFCLNSACGKGRPRWQVWWTWRWEGDAGVSISHLLWLLLLLSFGVHPRGRPGGSLAPGALYPPSSSLTQTPTPPSLSAFAQSSPMWTGHRTYGLVSPCSLARWAGRRVEKGLQPPSGQETSCNPGHLMLLLPCARESLGEAGMEASFLSCP